jgi:hypothetical protein
MNNDHVLSAMVQLYQTKHKRPPETIVVTPLALLTLSIKRSVAPKWMGIPVLCRDIDEAEAAKGEPAHHLGVFIKPSGQTGQLVSTDLRA